MSDSPLPFAGLRVLDCASFIAAPAAATILSDFGAEILKIEPLEGDPFRTLVPDATYPWDLDSRNKKSVALNLKHPQAREVLYRLVADADVFLTNLPLPVRRRLGIDDATLLPLNPRLIYASMTAYGETGPDAEKTGFDTTAYWARSGLQDQVKPDHTAAPVRSVTGMGDHPTATTLYAAIVTALYQRERTGRGGLVRSSLMACGLWSNASLVQAMLDGVAIPPRQPREQAPNPMANPYRCRDGRWINLTALNDRQFPVVCDTLGCPEVREDPRFATQAARLANSPALVQIFDRCFAQRDCDDWCRTLDAAGITFGLIAALADVPRDEQMHATGALLPFADGRSLTVNSPFELAGVAKVTPQRAPILGAHTRDALRAAGYDDQAIDALLQEGAIGLA